MSTSDVGVTSTDRFSFSLFLALMLHAALILGIGFSSELNTTQNVSIDITLSVANDLVEPDQANFIATTNQLGSGQESDVHEMTTRQHADFHNNAMAEVASQPSPLLRFPSSHSSPLSMTLSPQPAFRQVVRQASAVVSLLLAPSSQTVCIYMHGLSQEDWIKQAGEEIRCYSDRLIRMRNKPRPNNKWWGTDIKDELKDCYALVTNMSLAAVDAVLNKVPVVTHSSNVCYSVSGRLEGINERRMPAREDMTVWLRTVANNQFTLQEIEDGVAYEVLNA